MQGTIESRGTDRWRVRVYVGRDSAGKVQHVSRTVAGTKRDAEKELARLLVEVDTGAVVKGTGDTLADLFARYLSAVESERSAYTMAEYRRLAAVIVKELGDVRLDKLSGARLDLLYGALRGHGLSAASVRRYHSLIHAVLARAIKWGLVPANPADRSTPPRMERSTVAAPDTEDVKRLVAAARAEEEDTLATAIVLAAVTGARRGELCALRWSDVDPVRNTLTISRSLTVIAKEWAEGPTKTHQRRDIALDPGTAAVLTARREAQEDYARRVGTELVADPFILSRHADGSEPCLPSGLSHQYVHLARRLGVKTHWHELRHYAATIAIASGIDPRTVAGRLGHADASVTLRIYSHVLEAKDKEMASTLGAAVLGLPAG
jgi:integrase